MATRTTINFSTEENGAIEEILGDLPTVPDTVDTSNSHSLAGPIAHTNYLLGSGILPSW